MKKHLTQIIALTLVVLLLAGTAIMATNNSSKASETAKATEAAKATEVAKATEAAKTTEATKAATPAYTQGPTTPIVPFTGKAPKYIFMFVGDGMSAVQVNSAQVLGGKNILNSVDTKNLLFSKFPACGMITTHDATSFCPDSASTATSLATGGKTQSGVIGLGFDKATVLTTIAEMLKKEKDMKIGICSSVTINHATPAAYYSHVKSRNDYYDIAKQMSESNFDYFGGGSIKRPTGEKKDQKDIIEILKEKGYKVTNNKAEILALDKTAGKVYAYSPRLQDDGAMPYAIDQKDGDLSLSTFVKKGIDVLDNDKGFFLLTESGKIDWACHANDAMTVIKEVLDFEASIKEAYKFAEQHPDETLIVVTGDHETGGMTIGYASTGYTTAFDILKQQKVSYVAFDKTIGGLKDEAAKANKTLTFEQVMPLISKNFGLKLPGGNAEADKKDPMVLSDFELGRLKAGFELSLVPEKDRKLTAEAQLLYGSYDPLSVSITHIINNKAGVGWTSYAHTGVPVPIYAYGAGAEQFNGFYDNTDVFYKLANISGLKTK